jgi:hypothetical protein
VSFPNGFPGGIHAVSSTSIEVAADKTLDPYHNPTYPQRVHILERPELEKALRSCEERIVPVIKKLSALGNHPNRPTFERLYHQLLGARDQVAEAVRRIPLETGGLYREDKERFEQALAAFDRVLKRWVKAGG